MPRSALLVVCVLLAARPGLAARWAELPALGRLPDDVRPLHYRLTLDVDPSRERFAGEVKIVLQLDRGRDMVWLHGRDLAVHAVDVNDVGGERVRAKWRQIDPLGVVAIRLRRPVGPGPVALHVRWDAAFGRKLDGAYRVRAGDHDYVFTQFEPTLARQAFPSFDEPAYKAVFELSLVVPAGLVAVANTPVADTATLPDGRTRVRFAPALALPTYLLAFAVGPLDVVDAPAIPPGAVARPPLPFRGVAAKGRGARLAYALDGTPPLLQALEAYFAMPFPFPKLDVIAVPDLAWGGMENAGAITVREGLVLLDPATASESQRRGFAYVMAHEVAHQWFGDVVTMPWWDDLWLNEGFATWIADRVLDEVHPEYQAGLALLEAVHSAMRTDSLASARRVREPIRSHHDVPNAFDAITYSKGAGVLAMLERWLGPERFRDGIRRHVAEHRGGTATSDDLLRALSEVAGRDVAAPFRSFLEQPGVPQVDVRVTCRPGEAELGLAQSRYLPLGSSAERSGHWHVPVCVRMGLGDDERETCTLLDDDAHVESLGAECPQWLLPNAAGAGYYRWTLPPADLARLMQAGWPRLAPRERLSTADSLLAAFDAGTLTAADVLGSLDPFAVDSNRAVATAPMSFLEFVHEHLVDEAHRPAVARYVRRIYAAALRRLGFDTRPSDDGETKLLRARVIRLLAHAGEDPAIRRTFAARGRAFVGNRSDGALHRDAVAPELVETSLGLAIETGDAAVFDAVERQLHANDDEDLRAKLLGALANARSPALAERARRLTLDPRLHKNETPIVLERQMREPGLRRAAWEWLTAHFPSYVSRVSERAAGELPWLGATFCDDSDADRVEAFFAPLVDTLPGAPRNLRGAVELVRICAARVREQRASAEAFLGR